MFSIFAPYQVIFPIILTHIIYTIILNHFNPFIIIIFRDLPFPSPLILAFLFPIILAIVHY